MGARTAMLAAGVLVLLAGCATAIRGQSEQVQFDSEPSGAEMRSIVKYPCGGPCPPRDNPGLGAPQPYREVRTPEVPGPACITPCAVQVPRNRELIVTFSKPGYAPQTLTLATTLGPGAIVSAGNVIIGGAVGLAADAVTQAGFDHTPNPMKVVLVPLPAAAAGKGKKQ